MKLKLNGLSVACVIGERPDERMRVQELKVDIEIELADDGASVTDRLADTVDYAALAEKVRARLVAAKCQMIERAARLVAETCLEDLRVVACTASVTKSGAVPGLCSATAEINLVINQV